MQRRRMSGFWLWLLLARWPTARDVRDQVLECRGWNVGAFIRYRRHDCVFAGLAIHRLVGDGFDLSVTNSLDRALSKRWITELAKLERRRGRYRFLARWTIDRLDWICRDRSSPPVRWDSSPHHRRPARRCSRLFSRRPVSCHEWRRWRLLSIRRHDKNLPGV